MSACVYVCVGRVNVLGCVVCMCVCVRLCGVCVVCVRLSGVCVGCVYRVCVFVGFGS